LEAYYTPTSSNTTQIAHLHPENTHNDISVPYGVYSDPQIIQSSQRKNHPLDTPIPDSTISDTQSDESTILLVDYDVQKFTPGPGTSPDAADAGKTPHRSMPHHHLPPLPGFRLLNPTPYKRVSAILETFHTLTEPNNDPNPPEKLITAHQLESGQFHSPTPSPPNSTDINVVPTEYPHTTHYNYAQQTGTPTSNVDPQFMDSDIPALPQPLSETPDNVPPFLSPVPASECHTSSKATPSFVIHAQTVIINNYASARSSLSENGSTVFDAKSTVPPKRSTRNSEDKFQAPPSTPPTPPRDLSVLRSCHRPFSSLQRRSRRRQSMPARGRNWNGNRHFKDLSRNPHYSGWSSPTGNFY
jgi:hypothetical protein